MKIEEAIKIFEDWAKCNYEPTKQAAQLALTALRSMQEAGEPLSLEQLKQMVGKPVWIERIEAPYDGKWFIVNYADTENPDKTLYTDSGVTYSEYGKYFIAYPYPPAHIDRSKWTAEWIYDDCEFNLPKCSACGCRSKDAHYGHKDNFCPKCGRAMTEKAWVELKRRLQRMPLPEPPEEG